MLKTKISMLFSLLAVFWRQ